MTHKQQQQQQLGKQQQCNREQTALDEVRVACPVASKHENSISIRISNLR